MSGDTFHKVANVNDVLPGSVKAVQIGSLSIAICNVDGKFYAVEDVCTHDGARLDVGELSGCEIECPRHGARFDVTSGKVLCLPAVTPLSTYDVDIRGSEIWVAASN